MNDTPRYATLLDYVRVLKANRVLILVTALVFGAAGLLVASQQKKEYTAEATLAHPAASGRPEVTAAGVTRLPVATRVQRDLNTRVAASALQRAVSARVETRTGLVVIQGRWTEPRFAAQIANGFARATIDTATADERGRLQAAAEVLRERMRNLDIADPVTRAVRRQQLKDRIAELHTQAELVRPLEAVRFAGVPGSPSSPKPVLNTVLGLIIGLTIGILAAFVRDALDRRFRGSRDIQERLELPLLGYVREEALGRVPSVSGKDGLAEPDLEALRIVRLNMEMLFDGRPRVVAVTSGLAEEGKSTVAVLLAVVSAAAGRRTLLIECDLRRPSIAARLGISGTPGLSDHLAGTASYDELVQQISIGPTVTRNGQPGDFAAAVQRRTATITCVPAGLPPSHPAEMLGSPAFGQLLEQAKSQFDLVILDTAPLLSVVDARELLPYVDGSLLCLRAARTTEDEARAAKEALEHPEGRPVGLVVTGVRADEESYYGYYSYDHTSGAAT